MTTNTRKFLQITLAAATGMGCLLVNDNVPLVGPKSFVSTSLVSSAQARVGRPLTPMSYAGVARRTTRRAAAYGAAGAAAAGAYYYAAPGCTQVVDAYGRIVYHCP